MPEVDVDLEPFANEFCTLNTVGDLITTKTGRRVTLTRPGSAKPRNPGDDVHSMQPKSTIVASKWLALSDENKDEPLTPSAKTTAAMECIRGWQLEAPNDKILVFSQWAITAKIMGRLLEAAKIKFLYYWGDMNPQHRAKALEAFKTNSNIKVLVSADVRGLSIQIYMAVYD